MSQVTEPSSEVSNDYAEHNRTFALFTALLKWGTVATVIVLILMAIFLI